MGIAVPIPTVTEVLGPAGKVARQARLEMIPYRRRAAAHFFPDAGLELRQSDVEIVPRSAPAFEIAENGLNPVDGFGEDRIVAFASFEFPPQVREISRKALWKKAEEARRGCVFLFGLKPGIMGAVDRHVACVDLDDVMEQHHLQHPVSGHRSDGMLGQNQ